MYMVDMNEVNELRRKHAEAKQKRGKALEAVIEAQGKPAEFLQAMHEFELAVKAFTRLDDAVKRMEDLWRSETGSAQATAWKKGGTPPKIELEPAHVEWLKKLSEDEK